MSALVTVLQEVNIVSSLHLQYATYCFQVCPSLSKLYSIRTFSFPLTGLAVPSSWPKDPNTLARTHHWPVVAPHQELSGQLSKVVWIKSPVPLDIPGQRKSSPFWVEGAVPGMMVVTALMIVDLDGPNETLPPQLSRLVWVVGEPKRAALTRPVLVRRERRDFMVDRVDRETSS